MSRNRITHALPVARTWLERNNRPTDTGPASRSKRYAEHPTDLLFVDSVDDTTKEIVMLRHDGFGPNGQHVFRRRSVMSFDTWQRNATHYTARPEPRSPLTGAAPSVPPPAPVVTSAPSTPSTSATMAAGFGDTAPPSTASTVSTPSLANSFGQFPMTKESIGKTVVFMLDYLVRAQGSGPGRFMSPVKDALHEIRKLLADPMMHPLAINDSIHRTNRNLTNQGIGMELTMTILSDVPQLARFVNDLDLEIQARSPEYKALLFGGTSAATANTASSNPTTITCTAPVTPSVPYAPPAMLPAPEALVEEIAKMALTHAYPNPYENGGWLGFIEPEDHTWICFVGVDGRALVWTDREPNGQVHGLPAYLYRHDLAHAHIVVSIGSLRDAVLGLKEEQGKLADEQHKLRETIAAVGSMFPKGVMPLFAGGGASAVGIGPASSAPGHANPIGPNGKG